MFFYYTYIFTCRICMMTYIHISLVFNFGDVNEGNEFDPIDYNFIINTGYVQSYLFMTPQNPKIIIIILNSLYRNISSTQTFCDTYLTHHKPKLNVL